jgi:hypothetical protein
MSLKSHYNQKNEYSTKRVVKIQPPIAGEVFGSFFPEKNEQGNYINSLFLLLWI